MGADADREAQAADFRTEAIDEEAVIRMRKHLFATVVAVTASALYVGLGAAPVVAATATWTVTPGGAFTTPSAAIHSHLTDATTGAAFLCQGLAIDGTFKSGSGLTNPIGHIIGAHGAGTGPLLCASSTSSTQFGMTFSHFPMGIRAVSYDASTGVTTGVITGIHITLSTAPGASACTGTIDGTGPNANNGEIHFSYTNSVFDALRFKVGSSLHAYNVSGCGGLIHSGDAISYRALTDPLNTVSGMPNTITSP
jgi:hypothetical protein